MNWKKMGLIFQPSDSPVHTFTHVQSPVALDLGEKVRVFFSSRVKGNSGRIYALDVDAANPAKVLRLLGEPILGPGSPGCFDQDGVLPVSIERSGGDLYLYYLGFSRLQTVPHTCMIGLAISQDGGETFAKFSAGPVFGISTCDPYLIGSAEIVHDGGQWHMIYTSGTHWFERPEGYEYTYALKYASSLDGIQWRPENRFVVPQETEFHAYASPTIFRFGGQYHLIYSTRKAFNYREKGEGAYRLARAVSPDLRNWKPAPGGVVEASESGWDSEMVCYASVVESNARHLLFYNGNGFGKSGVGYAVLDAAA